MNIKIKLTEAQLIEALSSLEDVQLESIIQKVKSRKQPNLIVSKKSNKPLSESIIGKIGLYEEESLEDVLAYRQHSIGLKVDA